MLSLTQQNNPEASVFKLLKYLNINIEPGVITAELERHPDYPSMLAISDVLNALNIENSAFRINSDELANVPCPFITHTTTKGGEFLVVTKMDSDNIYLSSEKWDRHKLDTETFKKIYGGVVLTAEPSVNFSEATAPTSTIVARLKTPAILAGLALILVAGLSQTGYVSSLSWQLLLLTLIKSAGLITSILLLIQSVDANNPLVQVLCQGKGKTNCNAILSSKAAKVFEGLTWSEVGFFYFAGTWLLLLFGGQTTINWQVLALLNLISLPYTVYSIYYQARVAKQWCVLCCTVQAILWLEFIPLITAVNKTSVSFTGVNTEIAALVVCLLLPVILWVLIKPLFLKLQQLPPLKQQLRTFKYNTELFNTLLAEQPKYAQPDEEWSIVLGNVEADSIITMVTNPYCPPCAKTHVILDTLLAQNGNLQARIVFTANNDDKDIKTPVARHLMALNDLPDKTIVRRALHDWYEQKQKNYEAWAKVYPVELKESEFYKIDKQKDWCEVAQVAFTPTLLLNGHRLPEIYQLPDLKYMFQ